jgi:hypothetical protein
MNGCHPPVASVENGGRGAPAGWIALVRAASEHLPSLPAPRHTHCHVPQIVTYVSARSRAVRTDGQPGHVAALAYLRKMNVA